MRQEQIQNFTRRISQSNRGGLVVVTYDIILAYIEDAETAYASADYTGFRENLVRAQRGVDRLIQTLDFSYSVSGELYPLYVFAKEAMAKAIVKKSQDELKGAKEVLVNLQAAFSEAAMQDRSNPLMQNTQQVYAGITYGKHNLTETFQEPETSRGFFA